MALVLAGLACAANLELTRNAPLFTTDSASYLSAADNLTSTKGLTTWFKHDGPCGGSLAHAAGRGVPHRSQLGIGAAHRIGRYADAVRVPAGFELFNRTARNRTASCLTLGSSPTARCGSVLRRYGRMADVVDVSQGP